MQRITTPEDLFFPVSVQPVFTRLTDLEWEPAIPIPNKFAVVDDTTHKVLGVVSRDYRLVTNREACAFARKCAHVVFPETSEDEWEVFSSDAPYSRTYCHVDLRHKTGVLDFGYVMTGTREEVPDAYGPYIRVTNSYNAQRALKFTIGYFRKTCRNGLTRRDDIISFSFAHTRSNIQSEIEFRVNQDRVRRMQDDFRRAFDELRGYRLDRKHGKDLVKVALSIRKPKNASNESDANFNRAQQDWYRLEGIIDSLYSRYADSMGDNAYAALQAVTDLASHPRQNSCLRKDKQSLQELAGEWLIDFKAEFAKVGFDISEYLQRESYRHEDRARSDRFVTPRR